MIALNDADICDVGHGIHVANFRGCNRHRSDFPLQVHIWYGPKGDQSGVCDCIRSCSAPGMILEYSDQQSLVAVADLNRFAEYFAKPGEVLIHCAAGQCRGPTLALLAWAVRAPQFTPWHAIHDITWSLWTHRRVAPCWGHLPLAEIFAWWERRRK